MAGITPKHYHSATERFAYLIADHFPVDSLNDSIPFGHVAYLYDGQKKAFKLSVIYSRVIIHYYRKSSTDKLTLDQYLEKLTIMFGLDLSLLHKVHRDYLDVFDDFIQKGYISNTSYVEKSSVKLSDLFTSCQNEEDFSYFVKNDNRSDIEFHDFTGNGFCKRHSLITSLEFQFDKQYNIRPMFMVNLIFGNDWRAVYYIDIMNQENVYYLRSPKDKYSYTDIIDKSLTIPVNDLRNHIESVMYSRVTPMIKKHFGLKKQEIEQFTHEEIDNFIQLRLMQQI